VTVEIGAADKIWTGPWTLYDQPNWKENWEQTQEHYRRWWRRKGPILTLAGLPPLAESRDRTPFPPEPGTARERQSDPHWFAWSQRLSLARQRYPADNLPIVHTDRGCVQMAAYFGAEPAFDDRTVWYDDRPDPPDDYPALVLTKTEPWWCAYKQVMLKAYAISQGDYLVGMPAFGSNLDVLAELRGTQNVLFDLVDRPDWVIQKLEEVNQAFYVAYDDYYAHIQLSDGSSAYTYFHLWGPGKVSQVQCDFAAMISPAMFERFVAPPLQRQCAWLDHSLFHLDGPHCICHLDHLLAIPELDAVQWTPGAGQPGAGDPQWYDLYRRILDGGKSVQILGASVREAKRILDTFGSDGVFLSVNVDSEAEAEEITAFVESMREKVNYPA
jgi:hypothetical protein